MSRKTVFKNMIYTLNPFNLKNIGVHNFIIRDKNIIKLKNSDVPSYLVHLTSEGDLYDSVVSVSKKKYNQSKKGEPFGLCSVIRNRKHPEFIMVTEDTDPEKSIRHIVLKAWGMLAFFSLVLVFTFLTLLYFVFLFT